MTLRFLIIGLLFFINSANAQVVDRIVAVVNDDIITQSDVLELQRKIKKKGLLDEALLSMYDVKRLANDNKYLLEYLIDERTIDTEIKRQGIVSPIEQVESEIRNIARARGVDRNQLKMALKNEGVLYSDYQDFVKTSLQRQTLLQKEVTSKIKISDEDVNAYYVTNYSSAKALVYEYTLAHIVFLSKNGGAAEAQKRANEVHKKIEGRVPFETLAAQHSEDPQFVQGGLFGTFKVSDFNKSVEQVITKMDVGSVSAPVNMPDGFHIFKVLKKTLVPSRDLENKREEIRRLLTSENFKKQYHSWIAQRRKDSFVKIN
jgi:peptidyl-prolyl cis-trans isomerase SurA